MKICILGLWHLGSVTAACCASHFEVVGIDFDQKTVDNLNEGRGPLLEPGLNELLTAGLRAKRLRFTTKPAEACRDADLLWVCQDTPVDAQDQSDVSFVLDQLRLCLAHLPEQSLVLLSSQLPVGTCRALEQQCPQFHFACSPENLRLGRALDAFTKAKRVVVGVRAETKKALLQTLFAPFTSQVLFMRPESAEMVKHALNSFLAVSITFINEIARLGEQIGADAREVAAGLKSDERIGSRAYLSPGGPFAGGTLARDVVTLTKLAQEQQEPLAVIPAITESNQIHRRWTWRTLEGHLGNLEGRTIALLGLVYTPNTDTLRRSAAVELGLQLLAAGAKVQAHDPAITALPSELSAIRLEPELRGALGAVDAAVVCTEWPQFRQAPWAALVPMMRRPIVVDPNCFLEKELKSIPQVEHLWVGSVGPCN